MKIKKYNEFVNYDTHIEIDVKLLMEKLEHDCGNISDLDIIAEHDSYQEILDNGYDSIPFIIEKINNDKCHMIWFKALSEITNNYIEEISKYDDINNYWKKWASENGY